MKDKSKTIIKRYVKYLLCDISAVIFSIYLGFLLSELVTDTTNENFLDSLNILPIIIVSFCLMNALFGIYNIIWKYANSVEWLAIFAAGFSSSCLNVMFTTLLSHTHLLNITIYTVLFQSIIMIIMSYAIRASIKFVNYVLMKKNNLAPNNILKPKRMIIGAGNAADILLREFMLNGNLSTVKCLIDDNIDLIGTTLHGVCVVGNRNYISTAVEKFGITEIIFAIPSMKAAERAKILEICRDYCNEVKTLPNITELVDGKLKLSSLRLINVEDLLGRDPIKTNISDIMNYVTGKTVLVTGGGGSIGSELCRQIATYKPEKLVIVDIYENNAYEIQQELMRNNPELNLVVEIASIRDTQRIYSIFDRHRPQLVYHAAAHKHVPLMESNSHEAIKNNVFGTLKTVMAAHTYGVKKFVMISTDKAVNPTNIMGATKRICEMIVQSYNKRSETEFVAVRFGNVLGSNGSVIPLFLKQIENGGPVTVTHPDIIRYFMTIPEAVSLVLQAGALAKGGEIFVLNMGKPVKILELAENVIKLSGYTPYEDIEIKFTGLRPGEKLYEELLMSEEGLKETKNDLIYIGQPISFDDDFLFEKIQELSELLGNETNDVRKVVSQIVPTYNYEKK